MGEGMTSYEEVPDPPPSVVVSVEAPGEKWRELGRSLLGFHYRMGLTAMCRCGKTVIECDVQAHARRLGLLPALPVVKR